MKLEKISLMKVKQQVDDLVIDPSIKSGLKFLFLGLGFCFLWLAGWWSKIPPQVPLIYSRPYGESRLIDQWQLWFLPIGALIINLITLKVAGYFIKTDRLLAQVLVFGSAAATLLLIIAIVKSILLVV